MNWPDLYGLALVINRAQHLTQITRNSDPHLPQPTASTTITSIFLHFLGLCFLLLLVSNLGFAIPQIDLTIFFNSRVLCMEKMSEAEPTVEVSYEEKKQVRNPWVPAGTNWTLVEDVALCTSWVEVTHSSRTGNEMQLREMWSLIHTNYLEKMGGSRTKESMSSRWKLLSQSFSIWRDALTQASNNLRSGENYTDQLIQAQAWYGSKTKTRNKSFNRWECWNIVKDCPKFKVVPVGPEVVMNSTLLHSTPDNGSHEDDAEEVPEMPIPEQASGSTCYPIRPQGKKASKRKGSASKHDYGKYMEELVRHSELSLAREMTKFEADKAREEAKAAAVEREFQANERERELLRKEREMVREERMAQRDHEIMNTPLEGKSPNSKYFWQSEKEDVVRRRRAREARARGDGPSTTREDHPSTTNWLSDDE